MDPIDLTSIEVAIHEQWFCYRCGMSGYFYSPGSTAHSIVSYRQIIHAENFIGPLCWDEAGLYTEQCCVDPSSDLLGLQFVLYWPKNWFPISRFVLTLDNVLDANLTPVGHIADYVACLLSGEDYAPDDSDRCTISP